MTNPPQTATPETQARPADPQDEADPYLWLEEVSGERALAWVHERNAATAAQLQATPQFELRRRLLREVLDSRQQIPDVTRRGPWLYNLWRDDEHPRGLWRRTTLAQYRQEQPEWETVLDLDALGAAEGRSWVWGGAAALGPDYRRCLVSLSVGGADATVVREFDLVSKAFVLDGFHVPEAKNWVEWIDADTIYVGSDFGPGSLTSSGYPRTVRRWQRGQPLAAAPVAFEGEADDLGAFVSVDHTPAHPRTTFTRMLDFYHQHNWVVEGPPAAVQAAPGGAPFPKPDDAQLAFWGNRLLLELRSDAEFGATRFPAGSLLVADATAWRQGERQATALFVPTPQRSLVGWSCTRSRVLVQVLDQVAGRLQEWWPAADGQWQHRDVAAPHPGTLSVQALHDAELDHDALHQDELGEAYWLRAADFLAPDRLMLARTGSDAHELLKSRPSFFDASALAVQQRFARSADGTSVPYFVVGRPPAPGEAPPPTLLYGYGGFEVPMLPAYSGAIGRAWLAAGGRYVMANIRGGGEFGPTWHQAALGVNRQRSYDDFIAVAEDLIASGLARPAQLGMQGGSNGGLLVSAVMMQRPDLFGAVVCQVPLTDMRRYHRLLAGASWMAEYGDPDDPEAWAAMRRYSPYHNVPPARDRRLPPVLFTTSTRDDRVHPGHARKLAARLSERGHEVLYWENIEGGHGGAADNGQRAQMQALEFAFLWQRLGPAS